MIFYFSATGNSAYVAKAIATDTKQELINITLASKSKHYTYDVANDEIIGFVMPTYGFGLPVIVKDFLSQLTVYNYHQQYCFMVATYGTTTGSIGKMTANLLDNKGIKIDAYFSVIMPDTWTVRFDLSNKDKVRKILNQSAEKLQHILKQIKAKEKGNYLNRQLPALISYPYYKIQYNAMRQTKHLHATSQCIGCGLCARICPSQSITIINKQPVWIKQECNMCLSCLHHCPKFAIQYDNKTIDHGQYTINYYLDRN